MKKTVATFIGLALLLINPALARPAKLAVAASAQVVDSTGKIVGPYFPTFPLGGSFSDTVLLEINNTMLLMFVSPAGFTSTSDTNALYYSNATCSGTPYLPIPSSPGGQISTFTEIFYTLFGTTLYYTPAGATGQAIPSGSYQFPGSTACTVASSIGGLLAPAETFDLSTLGFVPPFRVMLK